MMRVCALVTTFMVALAFALASADTATSASGDNAAAFATDFNNSTYVRTGRRLAQEPNLATSTTGSGFAVASGDGKTIGSSGGGGSGGVSWGWEGGERKKRRPRARADPLIHLLSLPALHIAQPCRSGSTATSGPNTFAWSSGGPGGPSFPFIAWGPRPKTDAAAAAPLTVCPDTVLTFLWENAAPPLGVTQFVGPNCPSKFGDGEKKQKVIAPPSTAGSVGVRATKPGNLWFADPGNCEATITKVEVLQP
jgi:hypothetical protein